MNMREIKYLFLLFVGSALVSCGQTEKFERTISFDRNLIETKGAEFVCRLSEDSILLGNITDFTLLNDTSFVVADGKGAYLYHISGLLKKQFGHAGQARGEMISPNHVFATSNFVYVWCSTSMKVLVFDHEANFKDEFPRFERSAKKIFVDSNDEVLYLYTSGIFNKNSNKVDDVITIYRMKENSSIKIGERSSEDEVISIVNNSGGLFAGTNHLIYLHPGNLVIHDFDLHSGKTVCYKIEDNSFQTEKINAPPGEIVNNHNRLIEYMLTNSILKGLYKHNNQYILVAEIGLFDYDMQKRRIESDKNRKIKLYLLDASFQAICTILYDYVASPNYVYYSGALYFLTVNLDGDNQEIKLNRFSNYEL